MGHPSLNSIQRFCQTQATELPAVAGVEKVAITGAQLCRLRYTGTAAQHPLVTHEFTVVLTDGAGSSVKAGVGAVSALGPLPAIAVELQQAVCRRRNRRMKATIGRSLACGRIFA